ncbi:MAG: nicotinamide mononucleotide transporter [Kiritimatiellae bacterium]|nr:nicotinamide mononucleotide transporter [Kiritimatiellia bacterium]
MPFVEGAAAIFGLICVRLFIRQHIWCWPTGLVQVLLYIAVFYHAKLYSDLILHVIYVIMQLYGWYNWLHGGRARSELRVTTLSVPRLGAWVGVGLLGTALWGWPMSLIGAAAPYPDAFTTVMSLIAQWLLTRKKLESWGFWIAVDVVAIGVYLYKGLHMTAGLYAVFLVLAVNGLIEWRRACAGEQVRAELPAGTSRRRAGEPYPALRLRTGRITD